MSESINPVDPHETLIIPRRRRFVHEYLSAPGGEKELRIFFGDKEITFDGPAEMAFGERLLEEETFMAGSATTWARGEPYPWERVKEWLEALLAEGIIERSGTPLIPVTESERYKNFLTYEANRVALESPPWWNPDCGPLLEKLTGRSVELGYIESVVPVYRLLHPALDQEQRQVGEMNVFPEPLRMKIPTEVKRCNFTGSRYMHELPMNVTALRTMIHHWREMLQGVLAIREEFLKRYPVGPKGWKLGDVVSVSSVVLSVPTLMMMRAENPIPNGTLDPVLSSIFRVVDGVRMVSNFLLLWLDESRPFDTPMTGAELLFLTERDNHFIAGRGACAGPKNMVEELFDTLLDGKPVEGEPVVLGDWVRDIPAGTDYGLLGVQLFTVTRALWSRTAHAYSLIRDALRADPSADASSGFYASLERHFQVIEPGLLHIPEERVTHEARYVELLEGTQRGVRGFEEHQLIKLEDVLSPPPELLGEAGREKFHAVLRAHPSMNYSAETVRAIADATYDCLRIERSVLHTVNVIQRRINILLKRPQPTQVLTGDQLAIGNRLRASSSVPYLMDLFREQGIVIENTEFATSISSGEISTSLD